MNLGFGYARLQPSAKTPTGPIQLAERLMGSSTDCMLADLKAICLAKWPIRPLVGRPQMIILSARKRFGLWLRKTYAKPPTDSRNSPRLCWVHWAVDPARRGRPFPPVFLSDSIAISPVWNFELR